MEQTRKLTRRDLLGWSATAAAATMLAACQPQVVEVEKVVKETVEVEKAVEKQVTVVKTMPVVSWMTTGTEDDRLIDAVNKWQRESNIRVEFDRTPSNEWSALIQKVLAGYAAGNAPDVFGICCSTIQVFAEKTILLPLNAFIDKESFDLDQYAAGQLEASTRDGKHYGLPVYCGIFAVFYNKDLWAEAGLALPNKDTWDIDMYIDAAVALTKRDASGKLLQAGVEPNMSFSGLSTAVWSFGGEMMDSTRLQCRMSEPLAMEALNTMADVKWKHKVVPTSAETAGLMTAGGWHLFNSGKTGFCEEGSWFFCCGNMEAIGDRFVFDCLPHFKSPSGKRETYCTTDSWLVNAQAKEPDACWEFVKFLSGPEANRVYMVANHLQPALKSMAHEWTGITKEWLVTLNPKLSDVDLSPFIDGYEYARPDPWWQCHSAVMEVLQPVLDQIYVTGSGSVDELIPSVCEQISKITC